jgi:hypothetical protein
MTDPQKPFKIRKASYGWEVLCLVTNPLDPDGPYTQAVERTGPFQSEAQARAYIEAYRAGEHDWRDA